MDERDVTEEVEDLEPDDVTAAEVGGGELSTVMKQVHDTDSAIIQNLKSG
jgi:hypothetical protein